MSQPDDRLSRILSALLQQTEQGRIRWTATDDDDKFLFSTGKSSVFIDTSRTANPPPYWLTIANERGVEVEAIEASDPWTDIHYTSLQRLHSLARRNALNVDEVLANLLNELGEPPF